MRWFSFWSPGNAPSGTDNGWRSPLDAASAGAVLGLEKGENRTCERHMTSPTSMRTSSMPPGSGPGFFPLFAVAPKYPAVRLSLQDMQAGDVFGYRPAFL